MNNPNINNGSNVNDNVNSKGPLQQPAGVEGTECEETREQLLRQLAKYAGEINRHFYTAGGKIGRGRQSATRRGRAKFPKHPLQTTSRVHGLPTHHGTARETRTSGAYKVSSGPSARGRTNKTLDLTLHRQRFGPGHEQLQRNDCVYYNRDGLCRNGSQCPYQHNPAFVAVCPRFMRGTCQLPSYTDRLLSLNVNMMAVPPSKTPIKLSTGRLDGSEIEYCRYSHSPTISKLPLCSFFQLGQCSKQPPPSPLLPPSSEYCPYPHVHRSSEEEICQTFAKGFYCKLGPMKCPRRHMLLPKPNRQPQSKSSKNLEGGEHERMADKGKVKDDESEEDILWFDESNDEASDSG